MDYLADLVGDREVCSTGMRAEKERCQLAIDRARAGAVVSLISSGDPGIYGMAGLVLEMLASDPHPVPVKIIPGVSAAQIAAARLGAPLTLDYACISLSDLLVPWATIRKRLEAVAAGDLVTALYNPRSMRRISQLEEAVAIFKQQRPDTTPVGIATALGSPEEKVTLTDLGHVLEHEIDMRTIVLIGNSTSRNLNGWFVTPRGYKL